MHSVLARSIMPQDVQTTVLPGYNPSTPAERRAAKIHEQQKFMDNASEEPTQDDDVSAQRLGKGKNARVNKISKRRARHGVLSHGRKSQVSF